MSSWEPKEEIVYNADVAKFNDLPNGSDEASIDGKIPQRTLHRQLKARHIAMIRCVVRSSPEPNEAEYVSVCSIGGVIGTGEFNGLNLQAEPC